MRFRRLAVLFIAALWISMAAAEVPPQGNYRGVTIDAPHGWWRIHIRPDGSGNMNFAALPQTGRFPPGTFSLAEVTGSLVLKSTPFRDPLSTRQGTIRFDDHDDGVVRLYFDDWEFADRLFEQAWQSRVPPGNEIEREQMETLARFWEKREPPSLAEDRGGNSPTGGETSIPPSVLSICDEIASTMEKLVGASPEKVLGRVRDPARGDKYQGCRLAVKFPTAGRDQDSDLGESMRKELLDLGWREDLHYAAGGPGTMSYGMRREGVFCFFTGGAPSYLEGGRIITAETYDFTVTCTDEGSVPPAEMPK